MKQLLRCRLQVLGVGAQSAATHIKAYFQTDFGDMFSDSVFYSYNGFSATFTGIANGRGRWVLAADAYQSALGDYASTIGGFTGSEGYLWTEFDGSSACFLPTVVAGAITAVAVSYGGSGYTGTPTLATIAAPGFAGTGATFTCTVVGGVITAVTVTAGGAGYTNNEVGVVASGGKTGGGGSPYSGATYLTVTPPLVYPQFHRIRWMVEIGGDTTGTLVPTLIALLFDFWEYPKVDYQFSLALRLRVGDPHITNGTKADGTVKSKYDTPTAVVADLDALETLKNNRTIMPYIGLDGHTVNVLVTKVSRDILSVDTNGIQEAEVRLVLQVAPLAGTV